MKEEILTAKEWLEKETGNYLEIFSDVKHEMIDYNQFEQLLESYLEKYADYKSRILEDRIKEWDADIMVIGDDYKYHEIIGGHLVDRVYFFNKIDGKSTTNILRHGDNSNR